MELHHSKIIEQPWQLMFDKHLADLNDFLARFDRFPTQKDHPVLNNWLNAVVREYKKNSLDKEYIDKLDAIGMLWNAKDVYWYERYKKVKKQLTERRQTIDERENKVFHKWLTSQLTLLSNYKLSGRQKDLITELSTLIEEQTPKAKEVDVRDKKTKLEDKWKQNFKKLVTFRLKCPSRWPSKNVAQLEEGKLVGWCKYQRELYRLEALPDDYFAQLKEIGFVFNPEEDIWNDRFEEIKSHLLTQKNELQLSPGLRSWCHSQYERFDSLSIQRKQLLNSIQFLEFRSIIVTWEDDFTELKKYIALHNEMPGKKNEKLYRWMLRQREKLRKNKMPAERKVRLAAIGITSESVFLP